MKELLNNQQQIYVAKCGKQFTIGAAGILHEKTCPACNEPQLSDDKAIDHHQVILEAAEEVIEAWDDLCGNLKSGHATEMTELETAIKKLEKSL